MMSENNKYTKTIMELAQLSFKIPSYQRGYRWGEKQVRDLLKDIYDFKSDGKTWYCLQPIIVKKNGDVCEVIDGQQRLTTFWLIIRFINALWRGEEKDKEPDIDYETRPETKTFIIKLRRNSEKNVDVNTEDIDFYYISNAYKTINDWVKGKGDGFNKDSFIANFREKSKVIWYETEPDADGFDIFTRINAGKIPLTNAELIKALLLTKSHLDTDDEKLIEKHQLEIATEWDNIEQTLQNEDFWLFINETMNDIPTRIDFIFDIVAEVYYANIISDDKYNTFRCFAENINEQQDKFKAVKDIWVNVKDVFQTLKDWYEDKKIYHNIGYLIANEYKIVNLIKEGEKSTKTIFNEYIDRQIKEKILPPKDKLAELTYKNKEYIRKVLLYHNITTMNDNINDSSRFLFSKYKLEKWDIEHIQAIAEDMPDKFDMQKQFLENHKEYIKEILIEKDDLSEKIKMFCEKGEDSNETFQSIYNEIENTLQTNIEDKDSISNLVLLDSATNRGYKNAFFPKKRSDIIKKEKEGQFIPICTRNVFLKYYDSVSKDMFFWNNESAVNYKNDISKKLYGERNDNNR